MFGNKKTVFLIPTCNPAIIPVIVTIVCLVPFVGKAFHIDDPLFIWSAKQILNNPADFYGFNVNWYITETPMSMIMQNPPLACYYIAMVGSLFGFSEIALHIAFLLPAAAAALGMYYLARHFCSHPALAALAAVLTPAFLVSSTNVMCDTMMLAWWVWAMVLWIHGTKKNQWPSLLAAAILIATCALTKYFGMALVPLLFVYSLMQKRKLGISVLFLLIPVIILAGYQWLTYVLYGRELLSDAASYATNVGWKEGENLFSKGLTGLAFTGGCIITALFYAPLLWSRRVMIGAVLLAILLICLLGSVERVGRTPTHDANGIRLSFIVQLALFAVAGIISLALAATDFFKSRNADSLLLLLWVLGTFIFASFINWTANARTILPMVPAVAIQLMRRIDQRSKAGQPTKLWRTAWPLIPAALLTLLVCRADYTWANTVRKATGVLHEKIENQHGSKWFQGHWGFQYYMEALGARILDIKHSNLAPGDIVIIPSNNVNLETLPEKMVRLSHVFQFAPSRWLATMDFTLDAGFYTDTCGPLPFVIGPIDSEEYYVFVVKQPNTK